MNGIIMLSMMKSYPVVLLKELVRTDFKLRYQGSALGYLWSLLRPLFMFTILYFVFVQFLKIGNNIEHPPVYLLMGIVLWNYFAEVTSGSITAIVGKGDLLRKINFPKTVILIAVSASALINLVLNFLVIGIFMIVNNVTLTPNVMWGVLLILELIIFSIGVSFWLSAAYVRLRDLSYIWDVIMQAGFYLTPILYLVTFLPENFAKIAILSPVAQIVQDMRWALVTREALVIGDLWGIWYVWLVPITIVIVTFITGLWFFRSRQARFAEEV